MAALLPGRHVYGDYCARKPELIPFFGAHYDDVRALLERGLPNAPLTPDASFYTAWSNHARDHGAPDEALRNLRLLAGPGAVACVTGQQQVLLTGPLYTTYKIVSVISWSRRLRAWGIPAVPVFWSVSEDSDLAEIDHVFVLDGDAGCRKISVPIFPGKSSGRMAGPLQAMSAIPELGADLAMALRPTERTAALIGELGAAAGAGPWSGWHTRLLYRWFGADGLVVLDESMPALKVASAAVWRLIVDRWPRLHAAVDADREALTRLGYATRLRRRRASVPPFFVRDECCRYPVSYLPNGAYCWEDGRATQSELRVLAEGEPWRLSASVLTRPPLMCALLPAVLYCGGPGELAYHAQLGGAYAALEIPRPVFVPRASITLLSDQARTLCAKLDVAPCDALGAAVDPHRLCARALAARCPLAAPETWTATQHAAVAPLERLAAAVEREDASLAAPLRAVIDHVASRLDTVRRRLERSLATRSEATTRQAGKLCRLLRPQGRLQERLLSPLTYVNEYGWEWIHELLELPEIDTVEHKLVALHARPADRRAPRAARALDCGGGRT